MVAKNLSFVFMSCCTVFMAASSYRPDSHLDVPLRHGSTFREVLAAPGEGLSQRVVSEAEWQDGSTATERLLSSRQARRRNHHDRSISETQGWFSRPQLGLNGQPMLHNAVDRGDLNTVRRLIKVGALVNSANSNGRTALHVAALRGNYAIALFLLQKDADAHAIDAAGKLPLYYAAKYRHLPIVKLLVSAGTDQNCMMGIRRRPVYVAIACRYRDIAIYLIQQGALLDEHSMASLQAFDLEVERGRLFDALEQQPEPFRLPEDINRLVLAFLSVLWPSPEPQSQIANPMQM